MDNVSLSNLALKHLVEEIQPLTNGFVNKVQTLENNWIKMKVHTKEGGKDLVFMPSAIFLTEYSIPAKMSPGGYSALLKKYLFNQRVESIEQLGVDRIIVFSFPNNYLVAELFAKGNLILTDKKYKIIKAMKKEEWKDRKLEIGEEYKFPTSKGMNPLTGDKSEFLESFLSNPKTSFGACIDLLNVSPVILERIFTQLSFDKMRNASDFSKNEAEKIFNKIKEEYSLPESKVSLINKILYSTEVGIPAEASFATINSALNELLVKQIGRPKEESKIEKKQDKFELTLSEKEKQIITCEKEEKVFKETGDLIYLNYNLVSEVIHAVKKGSEKGLNAKEIKEKINHVKNIVDRVDLKNKKVEINL
jgi:predicted ribosome quality control (RQC) complex YloA/Tae2 family protein